MRWPRNVAITKRWGGRVYGKIRREPDISGHESYYVQKLESFFYILVADSVDLA